MVTVVALLVACRQDPEPSDRSHAGLDDDDDTVTVVDPDTDTVVDTVDPCASAPVAPSTRIWPAPGELFYAQIGLGGISLGESALVVGPDGTRVLIDAGNDSHDGDVSASLRAVTDQMNQAGFTLRDTTEVEHVVVTHLHADHADGLEDLLGDVTVTGNIVHRGLVDLTDAANADTVAQLCRSLAMAPGTEIALCEGAALTDCDPTSWSGTYPSTGCGGLQSSAAHVTLGSGAELQIVAADGHIGSRSFQSEVGPLLTTDLNGENARSLVGVLQHGDFRLLISGDVTAQSSDSDPVEEFYAQQILEAAALDARGVDVIHLAHHARDSSNSPTWLDVLTPTDGSSRNAIAGISTAHVGSPDAAVVAQVLAGGRLGDGRIWVTTVAPGGATDPLVVDAGGGQLLIGTFDAGRAYAVQAIDPNGVLIDSRAFHAVRACP